MKKSFILLAAVFGFLAVALGAFGAHGLKPLLDAKQIGIFETGIDYHFYHTLALLGVGILYKNQENHLLKWAARAFIFGICGFSGSLYLLATRGLLGIENWSSVLGPITPIGGLGFLAGWFCLFLYAMTNKKTNFA